MIRLFGVPPVEEGIRDILEWQELVPGNEKNIAFADSPAGFIYFEDSIGRVLSWDHDGGAAKLLAPCVDVFIDDFVFGSQADDFIGGSWIQERRALGLA